MNTCGALNSGTDLVSIPASTATRVADVTAPAREATGGVLSRQIEVARTTAVASLARGERLHMKFNVSVIIYFHVADVHAKETLVAQRAYLAVTGFGDRVTHCVWNGASWITITNRS